MWWSDRRAALAALGAALAVAGCGFSPAYAPGSAATRLLDQIEIQAPEEPDEYVLVARLENRLGTGAAPSMHLAFDLTVDSTGLDITPNQETLRYQLTGTVEYRVTEIATGKTLTKGQVMNFTSYSAVGTTVATRASLNDAVARLMAILADQIVDQLVTSGERWVP